MAEAGEICPELKITVQNDGTVNVRTNDPRDDDAHGGKIDTSKLLREVLNTFRDWLNQRRLTMEQATEAQLLGKLLYKLLFPEDSDSRRKVAKKFQEAQDSVLDPEARPMCVQLEFWDSQAELASLPWEFLTDGSGRCFVGTAKYLILTRFQPPIGKKDRGHFGIEKPPLRMLIVISKAGRGTVKSKGLIDAIQKFAEMNPTLIKLAEPLKNPTYQELTTWFEENDKPLQIVHFIGHGRYNSEQKQGEFALPIENSNEVDWVDPGRFTSLFTGYGVVPKLVFLQQCESGTVEREEMRDDFAGLVPELLSANVQAVVAMQFPVEVKHAGDISEKFYEELTKGSSVGVAIQSARRSAFNKGTPVAGFTPVLYMYGVDGAIVRPPSDAQDGGTEKNILNQYTGQAGPSTVSADSDPAETVRVASSPSSSVIDSQLWALVERALSDAVKKTDYMTISVRHSTVSDESIALNKRLYFEVRRELRKKTTIDDIKEQLLIFCDREKDTPLGEVLETMFARLLEEERLMQ